MIKFKEFLGSLPYKQSAVARIALGMDRAQFSKKKLGYRGAKFNAEERAKLASFFGVSVDELF